MLSGTDGHTKPQPQFPCTFFMQTSLYIILCVSGVPQPNSAIVFTKK